LCRYLWFDEQCYSANAMFGHAVVMYAHASLWGVLSELDEMHHKRLQQCALQQAISKPNSILLYLHVCMLVHAHKNVCTNGDAQTAALYMCTCMWMGFRYVCRHLLALLNHVCTHRHYGTYSLEPCICSACACCSAEEQALLLLC
jgi:hypothetical protein